MPDAEDNDASRLDAVDDHVGPYRGYFTRAGIPSWPASFGEIFKRVASRQDLYRNARGRRGVFLPDMPPQRGEVGVGGAR
jgi:hypothetical protein